MSHQSRDITFTFSRKHNCKVNHIVIKINVHLSSLLYFSGQARRTTRIVTFAFTFFNITFLPISNLFIQETVSFTHCRFFSSNLFHFGSIACYSCQTLKEVLSLFVMFLSKSNIVIRRNMFPANIDSDISMKTVFKFLSLKGCDNFSLTNVCSVQIWAEVIWCESQHSYFVATKSTGGVKASLLLGHIFELKALFVTERFIYIKIIDNILPESYCCTTINNQLPIKVQIAKSP